MQHLTRRVATITTSGLVAAALMTALAGPAVAADGSSGLLGSLVGDQSLVSIFIGNYQVRN